MNHLCKVTRHEKVGPQVWLLGLDCPELAESARPGQFVMLKVTHGPEPILARPFSIHGVAGGEVLILYCVVGRGTKLLRLARPGKKLLALWGPLGSSFDLDAVRPLLVAGGMGHAPLAFAARRLEEAGQEVVMLSGGRDAVQIGPLEEQLAGRLMHGVQRLDPGALAGGGPLDRPGEGSSPRVRLVTSTDDGSRGHHGLVSDLLLRALAGEHGFGGVLACGPKPMLKAVATICAGHGLACQVSLEAPMACGVGACLGCAIPASGGGYLRACREGPVLEAGRVDWGRM